MEQLDPRTDAELVALSINGDEGAFAAIYDRYADRLHSYCFVMLRDPHTAADAMHDTFVKAASRMSQLRDPAKLRPWLFAIARNEAHAEGRKRAKQELVDDLSQDLVVEEDPTLGIAQGELKELVWSAVAGLQDRDRELMTLHLVEGLEGDELASAMGVKTSHLHVMLSRMRDRVEKALGALLIARRGTDECDELAELLADWDGHFNLDVRSKVTRHVESCDICSENRALLVSPAALLPSVVFIPAPAALRGRVLGDANAVLAKSVAAGSSTTSGPPGVVKWAVGAIAAALVVLVGAVGVAAIMDDAADEIAAVVLTSSTTSPTPTSPVAPPTTSPPTASTTTVPPTTSTTTTTVAPASDLSVNVETIDFGSSTSTALVTLSNVGDRATSWNASSPGSPFSVLAGSGQLEPGESAVVEILMDRNNFAEGDYSSATQFAGDDDTVSVQLSGSVEVPPSFLRPTARPSVVRIPSARVCGPSTSTISVIVQDESGMDDVVARWAPTGGTAVTTPMQFQGNGVYTATVGPFFIQGDVSPEILATDSRGNTSSTTAELVALGCF